MAWIGTTFDKKCLENRVLKKLFTLKIKSV